MRLTRLVLLGALLPWGVSVGAAEGPLDTRTELELTPQARHVVLSEMRDFVVGLQRITAALSEEDMRTVAAVARGLGTTAAGEVPPEAMRQLPAEFRQLGFTVHRDFDQIALDAEGLGDPMHTLQQLSRMMNGCVACHASYQIRAVE